MNEPVPSLVLRLRPKSLSLPGLLLQRGFLLPLQGTAPLLDVLLTLPGFDRTYIEHQVETVFVNGQAVDRLDVPLHGGDTVALSAAMPGLAGAIFRRGGPHAGLRSRPAQQGKQDGATDFVTVKLFNAVGRERGRAVLEAGVLFRGAVAARFFTRQPERVRTALDGVLLDGALLPPDHLPDLSASPFVRLRIETASGQAS